jgi:hypothetical protein
MDPVLRAHVNGSKLIRNLNTVAGFRMRPPLAAQCEKGFVALAARALCYRLCCKSFPLWGTRARY